MTVSVVKGDPDHATVTDETDRAWRAGAACRNGDATVFFPEGSWVSSLAAVDAAKALCITCRVRRQCLDFAVSTAQSAGIWGGLTTEERLALEAPRAFDARV